MAGILDNLLDQDIADIADLPSYDVPPNGLYRLQGTKADEKQVKLANGTEAPVLDVGYKILEVVELSDPTQASALKVDEKTGNILQEFNETYFFHNDPKRTMEAVKDAFKEAMTASGTTNVGKFFKENFVGGEFFAVVKRRHDKEKDRDFARVSNVRLV